MFRKTVSIVLALMMLFGIFAPTASAASSAADTQQKIEAFFSELLGGKVEIDEDFLAAILKEIGPNPSNKSVANTVSQYAVVAAEDVKNVDAIAQAIADDSVYTIMRLRNGKNTLYIAVDIREHPELFDMDVFRAAVYKICDRQHEFVTDPEDFDLITYTRFAGELYLHIKLYQALNPVSKVLWFLRYIVERINLAEMNVDEIRFPGFMFDIIGKLLLR